MERCRAIGSNHRSSARSPAALATPLRSPRQWCRQKPRPMNRPNHWPQHRPRGGEGQLKRHSRSPAANHTARTEKQARLTGARLRTARMNRPCWCVLSRSIAFVHIAHFAFLVTVATSIATFVGGQKLDVARTAILFGRKNILVSILAIHPQKGSYFSPVWTCETPTRKGQQKLTLSKWILLLMRSRWYTRTKSRARRRLVRANPAARVEPQSMAREPLNAPPTTSSLPKALQRSARSRPPAGLALSRLPISGVPRRGLMRALAGSMRALA